MAFNSELFSSELFSQSSFSSNLFPARWTPPTDSTNPLWLKGGNPNEFIFPDPSEPLLAGTWLDKGGNGNNATQGTQTDQGTYDAADKSLNFDGDYMNLPSVSAKAGFFVVRNSNGQVGDDKFTYLIQNVSNSYIFLASGELLYTMSVDGISADTGSVGINGLAPYPSDNTGGNIAIAGYIPFPTHDESDLAYFNINTARAWTKLAVDATGNASKVDMHEIILLPSTPTTAERQKYEGYLAWQYDGLVAKLPVGHPYKLRPPYVGD